MGFATFKIQDFSGYSKFILLQIRSCITCGESNIYLIVALFYYIISEIVHLEVNSFITKVPIIIWYVPYPYLLCKSVDWCLYDRDLRH